MFENIWRHQQESLKRHSDAPPLENVTIGKKIEIWLDLVVGRSCNFGHSSNSSSCRPCHAKFYIHKSKTRWSVGFLVLTQWWFKPRKNRKCPGWKKYDFFCKYEYLSSIWWSDVIKMVLINIIFTLWRLWARTLTGGRTHGGNFTSATEERESLKTT